MTQPTNNELPSIKQLRMPYDFRPQELTVFAKFAHQKQLIDFDVHLPSIDRNLQRSKCWSIAQKQELINSIIIGRPIPSLCAISIVNTGSDKTVDIWQIIDGKQRLTTIFDYMDGQFPNIFSGKPYFFSELPHDYRKTIENFPLRFNMIYEPWEKPLTDEFKLNWFMYINHAGTPQDMRHFSELQRLIKTK